MIDINLCLNKRFHLPKYRIGKETIQHHTALTLPVYLGVPYF